MKIGAVFPQTEFGNDPVAIRDYAQTVEGMGLTHIVAYDHVLGAGTANRPGWQGYTDKDPFHEVFVLFGYMAAITSRVEFVTGILILPQRQTVLAAKQAAEVDVLSGGRFRLGVGLGWNHVEYDGLNEDFHTRGARVSEQVEVMRALWRDPLVTFHGQYHHIEDAGISPMPVRGSIPVWFGGHAEPVLKRVGQFGDGWFPSSYPLNEAGAAIERLHGYAHEAGRSPQDIGIEAYLGAKDGSEDAWIARAEAWQKLGATHLELDTMRVGLTTPQAHIDILRRMQKAIDGI